MAVAQCVLKVGKVGGLNGPARSGTQDLFAVRQKLPTM